MLTAPILSRIISATLTSERLQENKQKLQIIINAYATVGGLYQKLAKQLSLEQDDLIQGAQTDMELFVEWLEIWDALINASRNNNLKGVSE